MSTTRQIESRLRQFAAACAFALMAGSGAARLPDLQSEGWDYVSARPQLPRAAVATVASRPRAQLGEQDRPQEDTRSGAARGGVQPYIDWHTSEVHGWGDPQPRSSFASTGHPEQRHCPRPLGGRIRPR